MLLDNQVILLPNLMLLNNGIILFLSYTLYFCSGNTLSLFPLLSFSFSLNSDSLSLSLSSKYNKKFYFKSLAKTNSHEYTALCISRGILGLKWELCKALSRNLARGSERIACVDRI